MLKVSIDPMHRNPGIGTGHAGCITAEPADVTHGLALLPVSTHQGVILLQ
jgi:hypothetical protein